jgi:hypothetical protein
MYLAARLRGNPRHSWHPPTGKTHRPKGAKDPRTVLFASGGKSSGSDADPARVQGAQFASLPMRSMGRHREMVIVVRKLEHLAQIELGVVAKAHTGISGGMFTLDDAEFASVEPIRPLTRSVGHTHENPALIVVLG